MNKILEYQRLEGELINIDKKINQSNSMKIIKQANDNANNAKNEMKNLDQKAGELVKSFNELQEIMKKNLLNIQSLEKQKIEMSNNEQVKKLYANIKAVNNNLNIIEQRLTDINKNMDFVLKKFHRVKESVVNSKDKKIKAQSDLEEYKKSFEKQQQEIDKQMKVLSSQIEPKIFELYQKIRKENVYPVFVNLIQDSNNSRCGGCKSIIPIARINKLKNTGYVECEECRRIIFINDAK